MTRRVRWFFPARARIETRAFPARVAIGVLGGWMLVAFLAGAAPAAEDTGRIREKCVELWSRVQVARFAAAGEGKEQDLLRVYKDYDYLLKSSKTDALREAMEKSADPAEKDRLTRLYEYLLSERVAYAVGANTDNMARMARNSATKIGGASLTLRSFPSLVANEADRANRRNWYLATRDLLENYNVFLLNHQIDLDTRTREICGGTTAAEFAYRRLELDPVATDSLAARILRETRDEYAGLLAATVTAELGGLALKDLRAYDLPRLLRFATLDPSFPKGKEPEVAGAWLRSLGVDLAGQRALRQSLDPLQGKASEAEVFAVANERDTRLSLVRLGGLPDYLDYFAAVGEAEFYLHISPSLSFEDRFLGSPVLPRAFGLLMQGVFRDAAWRDAHLKIKPEQEEAAGLALRFCQLYDLRRAAGRHLFQTARRADPTKTGPAEFQKLMEDVLSFSHTASEQSGYLEAEDYGQSGVYLVAAALAEQLRLKLVTDFGPDWHAKAEAGAWLRGQWSRGYQTRMPGLAAAWGLTAVDPGALLGAGTTDSEAPPPPPAPSGETPAAESQ